MSRPTALAILLASSALLLAPAPTNASGEGWHHEIINGIQAPMGHFQLAHNGEKLGLLYKDYSTSTENGLVRFAVRTPGCTGNNCWTTKTTDLSGTANQKLLISRLVAAGPDTWLAMTYDYTAAKGKLWKTTDDGTNWSLLFTQPGACPGTGLDPTPYDAAALGSQVFVITCGDTAASPDYWESNGNQFTLGISLSDNQGAGSTGATNANAAGGSAALIAQGTQQVVWTRTINPGAGIYTVTGAGLFWTVPYGSNTVCSPIETVYVNLATNLCPIFAGAASNIQSVQAPNGHILHGWLRSGKAESFFYSNGGAYREPPIYPTTPALIADTMTTLSGTAPGSCSSGYNGGTARVALAINDADLALNAYSCTTGNPSGFTVQVRDYSCLQGLCQGWQSSYHQSVTSRDVAVDMTPTKSYAVYTNSSFGDRAELVWSINPVSSQAPDHKVAVTGLVGFDVDPTGATIITRQSFTIPNDIRTYGGGTLALLGQAESNCNRQHGVAAISTHVVYLHCKEPDDSGVGNTDWTSDVDAYHIRSTNLGPPNQPPICSGTGFCDENISDWTLASDEDQALHVATIADYPIDYTNSRDDWNDFASVFMAFAFSTIDGQIGVVTLVQRNNAFDLSDVDTAVIGGQAPDQICVVRDATGTTYLYGTSSQSNVKGFRVDLQRTETALGSNHLDVQLVEVFPGTASTAGARGIGCGDGRFAILNDHKLTLWQRDAPQPYHTILGLTDVPSGGITMSADGRWLAYQSAGQISVLNASSVEVVFTTKAVPGTFRGIDLQGAGSTLWSASDSWIYSWDIYNTTTGHDTIYHPPGSGSGGDPCGANCNDGGGGESGGGGSGGGGSGGGSGGTASEECRKGGAFLNLICQTAGLTAFVAGFVLVGVCAYGAYRFTNGHPMMVLLGAAFGLVVAVGASLLDDWFIIALGAVGVAIIAGTFAKKFTGKA